MAQRVQGDERGDEDQRDKLRCDTRDRCHVGGVPTRGHDLPRELWTTHGEVEPVPHYQRRRSEQVINFGFSQRLEARDQRYRLSFARTGINGHGGGRLIAGGALSAARQWLILPK